MLKIIIFLDQSSMPELIFSIAKLYQKERISGSPMRGQVMSVLVSLIKHFNFMRLKIVTPCEHTFCITRTIFVACRLDVRITQVAVRIRVGACRIGDANVVSATECWTIAAVPIYGLFRSF